MVERVPDLTRRILEHIPRLEGVVAILDSYRHPFVGGGLDGPPPLGARILRLAVDFDALEAHGSDPAVVIASMRNREHEYDPRLLEAFARLTCDPHDAAAHQADPAARAAGRDDARRRRPLEHRQPSDRPRSHRHRAARDPAVEPIGERRARAVDGDRRVVVGRRVRRSGGAGGSAVRAVRSCAAPAVVSPPRRRAMGRGWQRGGWLGSLRGIRASPVTERTGRIFALRLGSPSGSGRRNAASRAHYGAADADGSRADLARYSAVAWAGGATSGPGRLPTPARRRVPHPLDAACAPVPDRTTGDQHRPGYGLSATCR